MVAKMLKTDRIGKYQRKKQLITIDLPVAYAVVQKVRCGSRII